MRNQIRKQVSFKGLEKVEEEFLDHLEDSAERYIVDGYSKTEAIEMAILQFGDIKKIKREVYFMKQKLKLIRFSMWVSLVLFLFSFALTFKMEWASPYWLVKWLSNSDVNIFRVIKLISLSFFIVTIGLFAFHKKQKVA